MSSSCTWNSLPSSFCSSQGPSIFNGQFSGKNNPIRRRFHYEGKFEFEETHNDGHPQASMNMPTQLTKVLPAGLDEHRRLEEQALGLKELMLGDIIHAPIEDLKLILDVGCGTGIVTCELARRFPSASVIGIDASRVPISKDTPANVMFIQGDIHELIKMDERLAPGTFDYIFSRLLIVRMTNWEAYIREAKSLLRPGGWFEVQETTKVVYQHGEDISDTWRWSNLASSGARDLFLEPLCGDYAERWMGNAGFVDVERMEYVLPFGTWDVAEHPESKRIGEHMARYQGLVYRYMLPRFLQSLHMSEDEVEDLGAQCQEALKAEDGKCRILYVTIGRKPG